jgi:hypothetical protein
MGMESIKITDEDGIEYDAVGESWVHALSFWASSVRASCCGMSAIDREGYAVAVRFEDGTVRDFVIVPSVTYEIVAPGTRGPGLP